MISGVHRFALAFEFGSLKCMCLGFVRLEYTWIEFLRLGFMCLEFRSLEFMGLEFICLDFGVQSLWV